MAYNQQQHQQSGGQYGDQLHSRTDEYGNPGVQLDQFGNPIGTAGTGLTGHHGVGSNQDTGYGTHAHTGAAGTGTGTGTGTGYGSTGDTAGYGGTTGQHGHHHDQGGVMDKIKDNIPGVGATGGTGYGTNTGEAGHGTTTGGTGYGTTGQHHHGEQRGVMDKIKEKIPGTTESGATGTGYGGTTTTGGTGYGNTTGGTTGYGGHHEQKGVMDKIKEKIPCATGASGDTTGTGTGYGTGTGTGQHYTAGGDGRQHHDHDQYSHGTTGTGTTGEKKGIMGKIKEKLPGGGGGHSDNKY